MATLYSMVVIKKDIATSEEQRELIAEAGYWMLAGLKLKDYFKTITSGIRPATVQTKSNVVYATGTITFSSMAAADTVTVAGSVYTCVASGATGSYQFNVGASDTAAASNFAAKVNADATVSTQVTASAAAAVTTITAYVPGAIGNLVNIGISAHGSVSAATLAGGTNGDQERTHYYGSAS